VTLRSLEPIAVESGSSAPFTMGYGAHLCAPMASFEEPDEYGSWGGGFFRIRHPGEIWGGQRPAIHMLISPPDSDRRPERITRQISTALVNGGLLVAGRTATLDDLVATGVNLTVSASATELLPELAHALSSKIFEALLRRTRYVAAAVRDEDPHLHLRVLDRGRNAFR